MKTLTILIILSLNAFNIYCSVSTKTNGYYKNNTVYIDITIMNNSSEEILIPYSEWVLSFAKNGTNDLGIDLPPTTSIVNLMSFFPANYKQYDVLNCIADADYNAFELEYFPKTVIIDANDSLLIKLEYKYDVKLTQAVKSNNKVTIKIPFIKMTDFSWFFYDLPEIYDYLTYAGTIDIDLNFYKTTDFIQRNWKKYTEYKVDDCLKKVIIMSLRDNIVECTIIIKDDH